MKQPIIAGKGNGNNLIQIAFLLQVQREARAPSLFTEELADLLHISKNSAYRRIKGETTMSIDEVMLVSQHYGIPFSTNTTYTNFMATFSYPVLGQEDESFKTYLTNVLEVLKKINRSKNKQLHLAANDIPPFHYFCYPVLTVFKLFYHKRTILEDEQLTNKLFDQHLVDPDLLHLCQLIYNEFIEIPSVEVWHHTTIDSTLEQVEYYWDSGIFDTKQDPLLILDQLLTLFDNLQQMASRDSKLLPAQQNNFTFYKSDISLGNITFTLNADEQKMAFLRFNSFNTINTNNHLFCTELESWLASVIKKSTKISGNSEKQRNTFFKLLYEKVKRLRDKINREAKDAVN